MKNGHSIIIDDIKFIEKQPVKSLPYNLYKNKGISGTTILADSNVGLVLDILSPSWESYYRKEIIIDRKQQGVNKNLVMVVDDSLTIRKFSEKFLVKNGYSVVSVENGLEAIKYLEKETMPAIILMDIEMPVMDGFEALQKLKQKDETKDIPVVFISSRAVDKHINFAKSIGALDFLGKPFNEAKVLEILSKYAQKEKA